MKKPAGWPTGMRSKTLKGGGVGYYWQAPPSSIAKGYDRASVALGQDYGEAIRRAKAENDRLAGWRRGEIYDTVDETVPGTFAWMFARYYETTAFLRLSPRTQKEYRKLIKRTLKLKSQAGIELANYAVKAVTPLAADKLYQKMLESKKGQAVRVANYTVTVLRRAWRVTRRQYRQYFPAEDPWGDLVRIEKVTMKRACSRKEAYALAKALREIGYPSLGLVALICFEWHMRPENILTGYIKWSDYRPRARPDCVRLGHGKNDSEVWMPLEAGGKRIFAHLEDFIAGVPRVGPAMVMSMGERKEPDLYSFDYANRRVREARAHAGLSDYVTFDACRHGGMTELGDADASEQGIMAVSGHRSPQAMRRYVKRTEMQRLNTVKKRSRIIKAAMARIEKEEAQKLAGADKQGEEV